MTVVGVTAAIPPLYKAPLIATAEVRPVVVKISYGSLFEVTVDPVMRRFPPDALSPPSALIVTAAWAAVQTTTIEPELVSFVATLLLTDEKTSEVGAVTTQVSNTVAETFSVVLACSAAWAAHTTKAKGKSERSNDRRLSFDICSTFYRPLRRDCWS